MSWLGLFQSFQRCRHFNLNYHQKVPVCPSTLCVTGMTIVIIQWSLSQQPRSNLQICSLPEACWPTLRDTRRVWGGLDEQRWLPWPATLSFGGGDIPSTITASPFALTFPFTPTFHIHPLHLLSSLIYWRVMPSFFVILIYLAFANVGLPASLVFQ